MSQILTLELVNVPVHARRIPDATFGQLPPIQTTVGYGQILGTFLRVPQILWAQTASATPSSLTVKHHMGARKDSCAHWEMTSNFRYIMVNFDAKKSQLIKFVDRACDTRKKLSKGSSISPLLSGIYLSAESDAQVVVHSDTTPTQVNVLSSINLTSRSVITSLRSMKSFASTTLNNLGNEEFPRTFALALDHSEQVSQRPYPGVF
jgi:hypothetical protein